jgi:transposase
LKTFDIALYFSDEMRYGLMTNTRRSWSKVGVRAILPHQQAFENHYLYSAVSPLSGDSFHLMGFEDIDSDVTFAFLRALKEKHQNEHVVIVWDNAPFHRRKDLHAIKGLTVIHLPSYSPELSPAERFFEELRRATANRVFDTLDEQEALIAAAINRLAVDSEGMQKLLGYDWILKQCSEVI